ncbi:7-cyano-7-deazaguanine synthase QueC [Thioalkalivibrio paradoxus]|uniref:7-cyano-7-deazaguanine synthase n=1 Tax=Thioalkalivibrio paradoxus ARh 1 TaxID=713585 RepID=W0DGB8_9GAMM|nr:7-cyano-7-deazaguanine synthase QueC [Thioalkalivibrio paradoxus]AHE97411.1 7-cyano-7-deazaguanine synthase [Thioalkalivibrio paradoxus ARh 1]
MSRATDRTGQGGGTEGGRAAVVLLSGGLDSATCLALARAAGYRCHALSVDYGQRHRAELEAAGRVAAALGAASHRVIRIDLGAIGGSALTDSSIPVPETPTEGIPVTYVPARNTTLLALSLALTEALDLDEIFIGVNAVDYSGYPDCRPEFIAAFENLANLATRAGAEGRRFRIRAPLLTMTKAEIIGVGTACRLDYSLTVSCYQADAEGRACGVCDSCRIRRAGFEAAGVPDPTRYRPDAPA